MMQHITVLHLITLAALLSQFAGELVITPRITESKVGDATYFNCSTNLTSEEIFWNHGLNYIYTGEGILDPYRGRFEIDRSGSLGSHNLVIHSVEPGDAGTYICIDDDGHGIRRSAELIVLGNDPDCKSNIQSDGVIGQNIFNIAEDEVLLTCNVTYHGNVLPEMEWMKVGYNSSTKHNVTSLVTSGNQLIYTLKLKGDISLDDASYICQTTRSRQKQYTCNSEALKVLYFLGGNKTEETVVSGEKINCITRNYTFSCLRQWYHGNEPLSQDDTITTHLLGEYLCSLRCHVRGNEYVFTVTRVLVLEAAPPSITPGLMTTAILVPIVIVLTLLIAVLILLYKRSIKKKQKLSEEREQKMLFEEQEKLLKKENEEKQRLSEEQEKLLKKENKAIYGLSVLHQELFISRKKCPYIEVYDSTTFDFKRRITVDGMTETRNIASCTINNCLYASDWEYQGLDPAILRIDPINGNLIKTWTVINGGGCLISVASDTNVILCIFNEVILLEYTADGELIRTINLISVQGASHAVKLNSGQFVVGCCGFRNRVCLISTKTTDSNLETTDEVEILKEFHAEQVKVKDIVRGSEYVSVDSEESILVSDNENNQTVLLNSNLDNQRILISKEHGLNSSWRSCCDESTKRWFVTDDFRVMVCWVEGETVEREICHLNSHHDDVTLS